MNEALRLILVSVLSLLVLIGVATFVSLGATWYRLHRDGPALAAVWTNSLQCHPGPKCTADPDDTLQIPDLSPKEGYQSSVMEYCLDLILRITNGETGPVKQPKGLKQELVMYDDKAKPVLGLLWSDPNTNVAWLAFRGTHGSDTSEWQQDLTYKQQILPKAQTPGKQTDFKLYDVAIQPLVHQGFLDIYTKFRTDLYSKLDSLNPKKVIVTGHSLGGGIASLCAIDLTQAGYPVVAYTAAAPRTGNTVFADVVEQSKLPFYRFVNTADIIPTMPPSVCPNFSQADKPFIFTQCGTEVSFTSNWKSLTNNHMLPVYIDAVRKRKGKVCGASNKPTTIG